MFISFIKTFISTRVLRRADSEDICLVSDAHNHYEQELTDDQLEAVCGGMTYEKFSFWRAEYLNENSI